MVKKLFALASVSALAGLVSAVGAAGCTETVVEPGATPDSGSDAKVTPKKDSGPVVEEDADVDPPTCMSEKAIDHTAIEYAKANVKKDACTAQEVKDINKYLKDHIDANDLDFTQSEWAASVSEGCGKCAFSKVSDSAWGVIIGKDDDSFQTYNLGGCIEVLSDKEECGKAYQQFSNCDLEACGQCKTQDDFDACRKDGEGIYGAGGPCEAAIKDVNDACGKNVGAYENACIKGLETLLTVQCVTGGAKSGDAGDGG